MGNNIDNNKNNYTYFKFYKGVTEESKATVKKTFINLLNKVNKNKELLSGIDIHVIKENQRKFSGDSKFVEYFNCNGYSRGAQGFTMNPILNNGKKEICIISEKSSLFDFIFSKKSSLSPEYIEEVLLHEIGHLFDANHINIKDQDLINVLKKFDITSDKYEKYKNVYCKFSQITGFSNTEEFKQAWKKDVEILSKDKNKECLEYLGYFHPEYFNDYDYDKTNDINLKDGLNDEELKNSYHTRKEVFAEIFAYLMNSRQKNNATVEEEFFLEVYKNSSRVVKKYLKDFFGMECD